MVGLWEALSEVVPGYAWNVAWAIAMGIIY